MAAEAILSGALAAVRRLASVCTVGARDAIRAWLRQREASAVSFLKHRAANDREVHAVSFIDGSGRAQFWILSLVRTPGGHWAVAGGGGGGASLEGFPDRQAPWINLCGLAGSDGIALGGRIVGSGGERVDRVRIRLGTSVVEDTVDEGIALFVTNSAPPQRPSRREAAVELVGEGDALISVQTYPLD